MCVDPQVCEYVWRPEVGIGYLPWWLLSPELTDLVRLASSFFQRSLASASPVRHCVRAGDLNSGSYTFMVGEHFTHRAMSSAQSIKGINKCTMKKYFPCQRWGNSTAATLRGPYPVELVAQGWRPTVWEENYKATQGVQESNSLLPHQASLPLSYNPICILVACLQSRSLSRLKEYEDCSTCRFRSKHRPMSPAKLIRGGE